MNDIVERPAHYQIAGGIEAIDIIETVLANDDTLTAYEGYLLGNFLKYRLRIGDKDSVEQDLAKSNQYRDRLRVSRAGGVAVGRVPHGYADCDGDCENCAACRPPMPMSCTTLMDEVVNEEFTRKLRRTDPYPANWDIVK